VVEAGVGRGLFATAPRALVAVAALLLGFKTGALAQEAAPVRIATEGAHPPFNFVEANGQPAGFEVELGRALCEAARLNCVFVLHEWEGLIKGLLARDYDAIMNSLAITPRRKLRVLFSRPYYRIPLSFIVRKDSDLKGIEPADLAGRSIGIAEHTGLASFLEARYPKAETRTFDKLEDADLDLLTERLDLVFGDKLTLARFLASREGACCRYLGDLPPGEPVLGEGVAIAVRPDDVALKQAFDAAIAKVKADGTYDRIRAKHLPVDVT
jgi:polar amino acid transport system substrate-binding protein